MEAIEIKKRLELVKTIDDLAELLNDIKKSKFGSNQYKITGSQLKFFSNDKSAPKRYRTFHIRKKSGGLREIKAPCYQLNIILRMLNIALSSIFEPDNAAMGFAPGRSVVTNAQMHIGHNYVFNIDLKDFFPSIPQARVWKRIQLKPFSFPQGVSDVVAGLCCTYNDDVKANVLPQGAPTSPLLTNAICCNLDRKMKGVAKRFGLHYSRYADDMTFSSMHNVYQEGSIFRKEIEKIISEQGFTLNEKKTRLLKIGCRQEVTGLTVNTVANVSRKYIKELRWILRAWEKYGYSKAYALFYPKYKVEKGYIKKGEPVMENVVAGKLDYLRMVKGSSNEVYKKLKARYENLQQVVFVGTAEDRGKAQKFMFVQPYTMVDFEEWFDTHVSLTVTKKGKLVGKCKIAGMDKTLAISHPTQKVLCPTIKELEPGTVVVSNNLEHCYVILCRAKGKNYWMISNQPHKRDRILSIQNVRINPDDLLDIWEKEGFQAAAWDLASFVQTGELQDNIKDFNSLLEEPENKEENKFRVKNYKGKISYQDDLKSIPKDFKPKDDDDKSDIVVEW